ncbi:hypothetical protein M0802_016929 [Mischocyttarus mexicanus]|nr:hypothetical protein M0802_016929 [Mischocyttarus mexicanus]
MGWTTAESFRGGWSTPGATVGCRNSAMSFGGSVPSLHPADSIRSLRSQHSMQIYWLKVGGSSSSSSSSMRIQFEIVNAENRIICEIYEGRMKELE